MSEPKTLSPAEALRALAEGKKLTRAGWDMCLHMVNGRLVSNSNTPLTMYDFNGYYEHTEPRPKRKVAPYIIKHAQLARLSTTPYFYESDDEVASAYPGCKVIRRVTELEEDEE